MRNMPPVTACLTTPNRCSTWNAPSILGTRKSFRPNASIASS